MVLGTIATDDCASSTLTGHRTSSACRQGMGGPWLCFRRCGRAPGKAERAASATGTQRCRSYSTPLAAPNTIPCIQCQDPTPSWCRRCESRLGRQSILGSCRVLARVPGERGPPTSRWLPQRPLEEPQPHWRPAPCSRSPQQGDACLQSASAAHAEVQCTGKRETGCKWR